MLLLLLVWHLPQQILPVSCDIPFSCLRVPAILHLALQSTEPLNTLPSSLRAAPSPSVPSSSSHQSHPRQVTAIQQQQSPEGYQTAYVHPRSKSVSPSPGGHTPHGLQVQLHGTPAGSSSSLPQRDPPLHPQEYAPVPYTLLPVPQT